MKYKDFKTMSQNEMKQILGGNPPADGGACGTCTTGDKLPSTLNCTESKLVPGYCEKPTTCTSECSSPA